MGHKNITWKQLTKNLSKTERQEVSSSFWSSCSTVCSNTLLLFSSSLNVIQKLTPKLVFAHFVRTVIYSACSSTRVKESSLSYRNWISLESLESNCILTLLTDDKNIACGALFLWHISRNAVINSTFQAVWIAKCLGLQFTVIGRVLFHVLLAFTLEQPEIWKLLYFHEQWNDFSILIPTFCHLIFLDLSLLFQQSVCYDSSRMGHE